MPLAAVGGGLILYKKLPYLRGHSRRGTQKTRSPKPITIKVEDLNVFKNKEVVNLVSLVEHGLIKEKAAQKRGIKILRGGEIKQVLTVEVPISEEARRAVEKAGGKIV